MSRYSWSSTTAAIVAVATASMLTGACTGGADKAEPNSSTSTTSRFAATPTRQLRIDPVSVSANRAGRPLGITTPVTARIRPSPDGKPNVRFELNDVRGTGAQWAAAGWNAATTAMLITGAPLGDREIRFEATGPADGSAASALMTVAVIALMRGDDVKPGTTMTGAINPDGSIAPAAGVVHEVDAAAAANLARVLIPAGQREVMRAGKRVDVIARGRQKGIRVIETPDVYDAYQQLTGRALPRLPAPESTRLDADAYAKIRERVESWLDRYDAARRDFETLALSVQQDLGPFAHAARRDAQEAAQLREQGLQAGALSKAMDAFGLMGAIARVGQAVPTLRAAGVESFVTQVTGSSRGANVRGLVDSLKSFAPQTVGDAGALIAAYGYAVDAASSLRVAQHLFSADTPSPEIAVARAVHGAIYHELAGALVAAGVETLSIGQGLGGAELGPKVDQSEFAEFLRRAAEANLAAFRSAVVPAIAKAQGRGLVAAEQSATAADSEYGLARTGDALLRAFPSYFANSPTTDLAQLGGAINLYVRTAGLQARYSTLGEVNRSTLTLIGFANSDAFNSVIQVAQSQLAANIGSLRVKGVNPLVAAADNEVASLDQNAGAGDQFAALRAYWNGYLHSRVLAYLGGFAEG